MDLSRFQSDNNSWICPVPECRKSLSRKQTLKNHLENLHDIQADVPSKKYKLYEDDVTSSIPKSTFYRHRAGESSNTHEEESVCVAAGESSNIQEEEAMSVAAGESYNIQEEEAMGVAAGESYNIQEEEAMGVAAGESYNTQEEEAMGVAAGESYNIQEEEAMGVAAGESYDIQEEEAMGMNSDMDCSLDSSDDLDSDSGKELYSDTSDLEQGCNASEAEASCIGSAPLFVIPSCSTSTEAPLSYKEHVLAVSAFASRHNLSDSAIKDLLQFTDLHLPKQNLVETSIESVKYGSGFGSDSLDYNFFCSVCNKTFRDDVDRCQTQGCDGRKQGLKSKNYFVTGSLENQLSSILLRDGVWQDIHEQAQSVTISDITSSTEYKKLKMEGNFLSNENNISLSLFTDGIPLFKSSGVSLWPVYILINELPRKQSFLRKNMILWGIWQGAGKPNMTTFLQPLIQDLTKLYLDGMVLEIGGEKICCKARLLVVTMDLQARASVLHMTQYNGQFSCIYCTEPGEVVKSGKGNCRPFPFRENPPPPRTDVDIEQDARQAQTSRKKTNGFTGECVFLYLPDFSLISNITIDYIHGILLGITKKLLQLWFDQKNAKMSFYIGDCIQDIDTYMRKIKPPYFINRLPRKLSNCMHHWKASELRAWLLFYAIPCIKNKLPEVYLLHFSTLVEATYILLGEGISEDDLQRADFLLKSFVKFAGELYGQNFVGLNVHNLAHLVQCVRNWGPLWAWSCFCFESFNGELKKSIHGTGNVCRQIFWSMSVQKTIEVVSLEKSESKFHNFIRNMTEGNIPKGSRCQYVYQCVVVNPKEIERENALPNAVRGTLEKLAKTSDSTLFLKASKIIKNGFQMYSQSCSRVKKRNSYTIQLFGCSDVVEVDYFILHKATDRVYAVCRRLKVSGDILCNRVPNMKQYVYSTADLDAVQAEFLDAVLVSMEIEGMKYITAMPNNIERD